MEGFKDLTKTDQLTARLKDKIKILIKFLEIIHIPSKL